MKQRKFVPNDTTYTCKCGHRVTISKDKDKRICWWCGEYVFTDKRKEFEYRLLEQKRRAIV